MKDFKLAILCCSFSLVTRARPLPQGKELPPQGVSKAGVLVVPEGCPQAVLNPVGGPGFAHGSWFWHLTPIQKEKGRKYRYRLHKIQTEKLKSEAVLSFPYRESSTLLSNGPDVDGVTVVSFDVEDGCKKGKASWVSMSIGRIDVDFVEPNEQHAHVAIVGSNYGGIIYDLDARRYLDIDPKSLQERKVWWALPSYEYPLFIDRERKDTYSWFEKKPEYAMMAHGSRESVYQVPAGMVRVVVDGPRMVLLQLDFVEKHTGTLQFLSQWSGLGVDLSYRIVVPEAYHLEDAMIRLDASSRFALIYGRNRLIQNRWKTVFILDLRTSEIIGHYKADEGAAVRFADFDAKGKTVFVDVRDRKTGLQKVLAAFSMLSRTWYKVPLNLK